MTYIRTQSGNIVNVPTAFVEVCVLLRDMEGLLGQSSPEDPIPLQNIDDDVFQKCIAFLEVPVVETLSMDQLPDLAFFHDMPAPAIVELWRAADFLDYTYLQQMCALKLADMIRFCEPNRVMEMFQITVPPTEEALNECLERHPYLREQ